MLCCGEQREGLLSPQWPCHSAEQEPEISGLLGHQSGSLVCCGSVGLLLPRISSAGLLDSARLLSSSAGQPGSSGLVAGSLPLNFQAPGLPSWVVGSPLLGWVVGPLG